MSIDIVIVDNDDQRSALPIASAFKSDRKIPIEYFHEPKRSISLARNRAVANARGELIAFIDDDEFPDPNWLVEHARCLERHSADGVLGPVIPHFDLDAPVWLVKSKLCERPRHATGTVIGHDDMRTGNALIKRRLFHEDEFPFDPKWGTIGGGDTDFFERMVERGRRFIWCDEGLVHETVPSERLRLSYYLRRALSRGFVNSKKAPFLSLSTAKSVVAVILYPLILPFAPVIGLKTFYGLLIGSCDHAGRLLGLLGINPVRERPYESLRQN